MFKNTSAVYFWSAELSPHLLPLVDEVAKFVPTYFIAQAQIAEERLAMGWSLIEANQERLIVAPSAEQVDGIVRESPSDSVHIFVGIHWIPSVVAGIKSAIRYGRRFGLWHEPRVFEGWRGIVRLLHSWATEHKVRKHCVFVLAVGSLGPRWFRLAGYDSKKIFPFAYFPAEADADYGQVLPSKDEAVVRVGFLGRMIKMKGFQHLLNALPLFQPSVELVVAGRGTLADMVPEFQTHFPGRLHYLGVIPMSGVTGFMREIDILVLPSISEDDGWGVVVSEALLAGTAVVVSKKVGSSMCATQLNGVRLDDISSEGIASAVNHLVENHKLTPDFRRRRMNWARKNLVPESGAKYLSAIIDNRPYIWPS